jgi:hypothetical protein
LFNVHSPTFYSLVQKQEKSVLKKLLLVALLFGLSPVQAGGLDLGLSKDAAYLVYLTKVQSLGYEGADLGFGLLYTEDSDYLATAEMMVVGTSNSGREDLELGIGLKGYIGALDEPDEDLYALALGAHARYVISSTTPMGIVLEGFYAPDITSFDDTESMAEISLRYEIQVVPNALGYVGYRKLETELHDHSDEIELDDNIHFGIRLIF